MNGSTNYGAAVATPKEPDLADLARRLSDTRHNVLDLESSIRAMADALYGERPDEDKTTDPVPEPVGAVARLEDAADELSRAVIRAERQFYRLGKLV